MGYIRTFANVTLARHDPSFAVVEVPGVPGTLQIASTETGLRLVTIVGFPPPNLVLRAAARLRLSELSILSQQSREEAAAAENVFPAAKGRRRV